MNEEEFKIFLEKYNINPNKDFLQQLADIWNELSEPQEPTIDQLKKHIKYSKNPLEVKMLNKKLNQLYKEMKKR